MGTWQPLYKPQVVYELGTPDLAAEATGEAKPKFTWIQETAMARHSLSGISSVSAPASQIFQNQLLTNRIWSAWKKERWFQEFIYPNSMLEPVFAGSARKFLCGVWNCPEFWFWWWLMRGYHTNINWNQAEITKSNVLIDCSTPASQRPFPKRTDGWCYRIVFSVWAPILNYAMIGEANWGICNNNT